MRLLLLSLVVTLPSVGSGQTAAEHIAAGDRHYAAMAADSALDRYEKAIASDQRSFQALWKASRSAVDIGSYANEATRRPLFTRAEQYARKAVSLNPGDPEGHFSLARALGKTALTQSPRGRVRFATEIRGHALECLRLEPKHPGCLHVMGMWNAEVMRLNSFTRAIAKNVLGGRVFGTASWSEAVRYMEASVAAEPERIVHRVDLAEIYAHLGQHGRARTENEMALRLPATDVNDIHYKAQARRALGIR
jgi:tetratricopeptide (TPR) repeat protein